MGEGVGANQIIFGVAIAFLVWWMAGAQFNRRRAAHVARLIGQAIRPLGRGAAMRPLGNSAFRVDLERPAAGLEGLTLLCLLEPRDFPLAWLWMRIRGHRDRIVIKAAFDRPPAEAVQLQGDEAARRYDLPGLTVVNLQPSTPHLHLTVNLVRSEGLDEADQIQRTMDLVRRLVGTG
ncbi:MAG TPA: hypothetical protein VF282_08855 [Bacillota bacterium]